MVSNATEEMMKQIQSALLAAMPDALEPLVAVIKERVSVPVQRIGGRTIRSKPGEPPRKDTGKLQISVEALAIEGSDTVRGSVSVGVPYAAPLNNEMNRPIAGDEPEKHLDGIADVLADRITASNT